MPALAAGCGSEGSLAPSTAPLREGTQVSPQRYLADAAAAAAAVSDFSIALASVGEVARPVTLRRAAPELRASLERVAALSARLDAQRLQDRRLEVQRDRAADALDAVLTAMTQVVEAAEAGDGAAAAAAAGEYSTAVGVLRSLAPPS